MKKLKQVNKEIENLLDEKEKCEIKLQQLKNQEKKIKKEISQIERRKRTKRLIERGAILEKYIDEAEELSNLEIQAILDKVFLNIS